MKILNKALRAPVIRGSGLLWVIILPFLIVLPFAPSFGKVYLSRLLTQRYSIFDSTGGWQQIYKAPMTINGARAILSIYGCDEPLKSATARLRQNFSSSRENFFIENENSTWLLSTADNQIIRLLALAVSNPDRSLIFALVQSPAEFSRETAGAGESVFPGHSFLPESRRETIIKNEETGAVLETRITAAAPEQAMNEISAELSKNGWKPLLPAGDYNAARHYFQVFQRSTALCVVTAGNALRENKTCVTILLKKTNAP